MTKQAGGASVSVIVTGDTSVIITQSQVDEILQRTQSITDNAEVIVVADNMGIDTSHYNNAIRILEPQPDLPTINTVQNAVQEAKGDLLMFMDGSAAHAPKLIPDLINPLITGAHELVIAGPAQAYKPTGLSLARRSSAWLSKKLLACFTDLKNPQSGLFAFRRDILGEGQFTAGYKVNPLVLLLRWNSEIRTLELEDIPPIESTSCSEKANASVFTTIRQLLAVTTGYDALKLDKQSRFKYSLGIATDIIVVFALVAAGFNIATAHVSSFLAGITALAITHLVLHRHSLQFTREPWARFRVAMRYLVLVIMSLAMRGGVMATLIVAGLAEFVAISAGIVLGWVVVYLGKAYPYSVKAQANSANLCWTLAAFGVLAYILVLRLFYLGAFEAMPQEAYYWNYAVRLSPGYLDHPPMVAVLIWIGELLFGHNEFGLRFVSYLSGFVLLVFAYLYARRLTDRSTAIVATAIALLLPYYFFGSGLFITPDTILTVAWAMTIYFFHKALVSGDKRAWYGVGLGLGLGMLSKYTIALLGPAALLYLVIDNTARRWFVRPQPYVAVVIALAVFSPVIYWNATNDWASFQFQAQDRFLEVPQFSVPLLFQNIVSVVTPLPLLIIPLLFVSTWTKGDSTIAEPELNNFRNRLFIGCFVFVPLAVFLWNSIENEPRLNWTGPVWVAMLPMMAWTVVQASNLRWSWLRMTLHKAAAPMFAVLLVTYALALHFLVVGLPGVGYPKGLARLIGWPQAAQQLEQIQQDIIRDGGDAPVIVGLDKYFIASKFAFYGTPEYLSNNSLPPGNNMDRKSLRVTGIHLLDDQSLMFSYWDPVEQFRDRTVIMVARSPGDLSDARVGRFFQKLNPEINTLPLRKAPLGGQALTVREYYYRIGYGYIPPDNNNDKS